MTSRRLLTPIAKNLLDAADLIEQHGLCKHTRTEGGRFCVLGAISQAAVGNPWKLNSYHEPAATFERHINQSPGPWNNEPERTAAEVIHALRQAALATPQGEGK